MSRHWVEQATVHGGRVVLSGLPIPDGERVQVIVTDLPQQQSRDIREVRRLLRGGVERYDDPFEPHISMDSWEMLR